MDQKKIKKIKKIEFSKFTDDETILKSNHIVRIIYCTLLIEEKEYDMHLCELSNGMFYVYDDLWQIVYSRHDYEYVPISFKEISDMVNREYGIQGSLFDIEDYE